MRRFSLGMTGALLLCAGSAQAELKTEVLTYKVGDVEMTGYLAYDDDVEGERPGVLVVHEWWGHNAYARKRAEMLAAVGAKSIDELFADVPSRVIGAGRTARELAPRIKAALET